MKIITVTKLQDWVRMHARNPDNEITKALQADGILALKSKDGWMSVRVTIGVPGIDQVGPVPNPTIETIKQAESIRFDRVGAEIDRITLTPGEFFQFFEA